MFVPIHHTCFFPRIPWLFNKKNPHFWPLQVDVLFEKANELSVAELEAMGGVVVVCPLKSSRCFG